MLKLAEAFPAEISNRAFDWFSAWGCPQLHKQTTVRFSRRMYRSIGRCYPERRLLSLNESLREMRDVEILDVLCHELAHIVAYEFFGRHIKPHGKEWRALVGAVGFVPRTKYCGDPTLGSTRNRTNPRPRYLHRCLTCFAQRIAGRPVHSWRCAECVENGLPGDLTITRLEVNEP